MASRAQDRMRREKFSNRHKQPTSAWDVDFA
jgi:hypothetical protein